MKQFSVLYIEKDIAMQILTEEGTSDQDARKEMARRIKEAPWFYKLRNDLLTEHQVLTYGEVKTYLLPKCKQRCPQCSGGKPE